MNRRRTISLHGHSQESGEMQAEAYNVDGVTRPDSGLFLEALTRYEDAGRAGVSDSKIAKVMRLLEKISAALLDGIAVSVQVGNILICILILLGGTSIILRLLS